MENTNIVVCEIIYYDIISGEQSSAVGKINQSELKDFSNNDNGFVMPIGTNFLINKHDIKEIIIYREVGRLTKQKGESTLYHELGHKFGAVVF